MTTVTAAIDTNAVAALRKEVAVAVGRAYGAERAYAQKLNEVLTAEWYLVEASDVSDAAKPVHAEKKALFAELKAVKHSNPSTIWARIRKYAKEEMEGDGSGAGEGEGSGNGEAESNGGAKHARTPMLRNVEDLTALYKFNKRQEFLDEKLTQAQQHIASALMALGLDLSMLESGKK